MAKEPIFTPKVRESFSQFGIFGWLYGALGLVILAGIIMLMWMTWNFQDQSRNQSANNAGRVPAHGDFVAGRAKKDDVLFRLAGTSRAGRKLVPELAASWMRANGYGAVTIKTQDRIVTISGLKGTNGKRILVYLGSATGGFEAMIQKRVEGVYSGREVTSSEADRLSAFGDMFNAASEKVIAHDISFLFVNNSNSSTSMNGDILARIMAGDVKDWSEVSPKENGDIHIYYENLGGDNGFSPLDRILGERELIDTAKSYDTPNDVINAVVRDGKGIGFAHRDGNVGLVKSVAFQERNARSFGPNDFDIAIEAYPFTERVYLYVPSVNGNADLRSFADFTQTQAAQEVVKTAGFWPQILQNYAVAAPQDAPVEYKTFSQSSRRMNFDFRFQQGANSLDTKAVSDITRFVQFLQSNNISGNRVALFGFADNVGARPTNIGLGQARAEAVLNKLSQMGVQAGLVRSFGDVMPVGANAFEDGRIKNRRVEAWICPPPACPVMALVSQAQTQAPAQITPQQQGIPNGVRIGRSFITPEGETPPKG